MKRTELDRMSTDDLWWLHIEVSQLLQQSFQQEKLQLEEHPEAVANSSVRGQAIPTVPPNTSNPDEPSETSARSWQAAALAGRTVALQEGGINDFQDQEGSKLEDQPPPPQSGHFIQRRLHRCRCL